MRCVVGYILFLLFASFLGLGCINAPPFVCTEDAQCNSKPPGICIAWDGHPGACAVPAGDCTSGYRYHNSAQPDQIGKCAAIPRLELTPSVTTAEEHQSFSIHITARDETGAKLSTYNGKPKVNIAWKDATITKEPQFISGEADMNLSLNRETTIESGPAVIQLRDVALQGQTAVNIKAPKWDILMTVPLLPANSPIELEWIGISHPKDFFFYSLVARGRTGTTRKLYYDEQNLEKLRILDNNFASIGGETTDFGYGNFIQDEKTYLISYDSRGKTGKSWGIGVSDTGFDWTVVAEPPQIVFSPTPDHFCEESLGIFQTLGIESPGHYRMFYIANARNGANIFETAGTCTAESSDGGKTWTNPAPLDFFDTGISTFVKDGSVYKAWDLMGRYLTSSDAIHWTSTKTSLFPKDDDRFGTVIWEEEFKRYTAVARSKSGKEMEVYTRP